MSDNSQEPSPQALYISRLDVKLSQQSRKQVKALKLQIRNRTLKDFRAAISPSGSHTETFIPALVLQPGDPFSVSVQCRTQFRNEEVKIAMDHREILSGTQGNSGIRTYEKTERNISVIVSFYLLPPTTRDIIECCPRFRVLIIGNSGVGKSSLIKKLFGVDEVHVADNERGEADIDTEFISSQNALFVLHDTKGFEEADANNVETVKEFVTKYKDKPQIKDRLHAVWMCLDIPYSSGRLLESGAEDFLRRRREVLGDVPLVVVLTKADLLDNQLECDMLEDDSDGKTFEQRKSEFLKKYCIQPLHAAAGDVPYVIVSTKVLHPIMLANLTEITTDCVNKYIGEEASMVAAMAQRASIKLNVESSITIGRKKYWSRLAKSAFFSGYTLKECVQVLHQDIVAVWNFHDPDKVLQQDNFIGALLRTEDLNQQPPASPPVDVSPVLGLVKAIAGSAPEPTVIILVSIVDAAIWLVQLAYQTYQQTAQVVKLFMLYIVGSMFVMQIIFLLAPEGHVTSQVVEHAIYTYLLSKKQRVREQIDGFDIARGLLPGGSDHVLEKVELLIKSCSISEDEIEELRQTFPQQSRTQEGTGEEEAAQ